LGKGDKVAIFDYGTSPVSYLASSAFTPYLARGAADVLGCLTICNDGVANMSRRAVEIVQFVQPRILFLRSDCLHPFAAEIEKAAMQLSDYTSALVVTENEGVLSDAERQGYQRRLRVPIYRLLRMDLALFLAMECPECRLFHGYRDLYFLECIDDGLEGSRDDRKGGILAITNLFARACPTIRYVSQVKGSLVPAGCPKGPNDQRISA